MQNKYLFLSVKSYLDYRDIRFAMSYRRLMTLNGYEWAEVELYLQTGEHHSFLFERILSSVDDSDDCPHCNLH